MIAVLKSTYSSYLFLFPFCLVFRLPLSNRLEELGSLGYPVLLGTSRKSVVGLTLDLPAEERIEGTLVTTVFSPALIFSI